MSLNEGDYCGTALGMILFGALILVAVGFVGFAIFSPPNP